MQCRIVSLTFVGIFRVSWQSEDSCMSLLEVPKNVIRNLSKYFLHSLSMNSVTSCELTKVGTWLQFYQNIWRHSRTKHVKISNGNRMFHLYSARNLWCIASHFAQLWNRARGWISGAQVRALPIREISRLTLHKFKVPVCLLCLIVHIISAFLPIFFFSHTWWRTH